LESVHEWTNRYQGEFESLTFSLTTLKGESIPLDKDVGEPTSEADIRYSLGRAKRPKKLSMSERFRKGGSINEDDFSQTGKRKEFKTGLSLHG